MNKAVFEVTFLMRFLTNRTSEVRAWVFIFCLSQPSSRPQCNHIVLSFTSSLVSSPPESPLGSDFNSGITEPVLSPAPKVGFLCPWS